MLPVALLIAGVSAIAIAPSATAVGQPTTLVATAGDGSAELTWDSTPSDAQLWYIQVYEGSTYDSDLDTYDWPGTDPGEATVSGLTNGVTYTFQLTLYDTSWTASDPITSNAVTPGAATAVPSTPTSVSATATIGGHANVTWSRGSTFATDYVSSNVVTASPGGATATVSGAATSASFSGLTYGTAYTFSVKAQNAIGDSSASTSSSAVTSGNVPGAPTGVTSTSTAASLGGSPDGTITVNWTAPSATNGAAITGYTITPSSGSPVTASSSATSYTFTGLAGGTSRSFTVKATNTWGDSAASSSTTALVGTSGPPVDVVATAGDGSAELTWTNPTDPAPFYYYIEAYRGGVLDENAVSGDFTWGAQSDGGVVTGLTNGVSYTFKVVVFVTDWDHSYTSDFSNAVTTAGPTSVPSAPTSVSATASIGGNATVTWSQSSTYSTDAVQSNTVTASPGGASVTVGAGATTANFSGLTYGTAYTFTVKANNSQGASAASSASSAVTSGNVPGAPTGVSVTTTSVSTTESSPSGTMTVHWTAPSANGAAITGYTITPSSGSPVTASSSATSYTFTGLAGGTGRSFTVKATNSWGTSAASSAVGTTIGTYGQATDVTATAGDGSADVTWTNPTDPAPFFTYITAYHNGVEVTSTDGDFVGWGDDGDSGTITGLTNGVTYTFKVTIFTTDWDTSYTSDDSNEVTPTGPMSVPSAPTSVSATASIGGNATVTWSQASTYAADVLHSNTVTASPGGASVTVGAGATSANFSGLTYGTAYTFTVKATNSQGSSVASAASSAVTSGNVPGAPTGVAVTTTPASIAGPGSDGTMTVTWTAPSSNGAAISGYTITPSSGSPVTVSGSTTSYTYTGLAGGTGRSFTVKATNSWGDSAASSAAGGTVGTTGPPVDVVATAGDASADLTWTNPTDPAPFFYYIEAYHNGVLDEDATSADPSWGDPADSGTITGLQNGVTYTFKVTIFTTDWDHYYTSDFSNEITTVGPTSVPSAPTSVSATASIGGHAAVSWSQSSTYSSDAVQSNTVTASPGGASVTVGAGATSANFSGLTYGTAYTFTVRATNSQGSSAASSASSAVTSGNVPAAPVVSVDAQASTVGNSDGAFTVSWPEPANNGAAITSYTVTPSSGSPVTVTGSTSHTFTGIAGGTTRSFTVKATNSWGDSAASTSVSATVIDGGPVQNVVATAGDGSADLTWDEPGGDAAPFFWYIEAFHNGVADDDASGWGFSDDGRGGGTVTGLTNGLAYTFKVVIFVGDWSTSYESASSNEITPHA